MPIENPHDLLILLAIPLPMAAGIAVGLIALNQQVTSEMNPRARRLLRPFGFLAGASCGLMNTATSVSWWWSWRYFEDPAGTPPALERAIDLGILTGGIGLIAPFGVVAISWLLRTRARSAARVPVP